MKSLFPRGSARFSECLKYRYELTRDLAPGLDPKTGRQRIVWLMMNPSTADADVDDRTVAKIQKYGSRWGFHDLTVINVYAYRATLPANLWRAHDGGVDIVGPENDATIVRVCQSADRLMLGWGLASATTIKRHRVHAARVKHVMTLLADACQRPLIAPRIPVLCLGVNKDGSPVHPLYQPDDREAVMFGMEEA